MAAAVERYATSALAAALAFSILFFSGGTDPARLFWIGGAAIVAAAVAAAAAALRPGDSARLDGAAAGFLGCLAALAVWCGLSILWSQEPDTSWRFTNRMLVYVAFALLGALAAARLRLPARTAADALAALLGLVFGWALLAKAVPGLYTDYERVARLRAPVGYWNALAVLGVAGVSLGVGLAVARGRHAAVRAAGPLLVFGGTLVVLLAYSRANVALLLIAAAAWLALEPRRPEALASLAVGALPAVGVFAICLALPGITDDGVTRAQRAHDGWIFALLVLAGAAVSAGAAAALVRLAERRPLSEPARERVDAIVRVGLAVALVAAVVVVVVFADRIWHDFRAANEVSQGQGRFKTLASGNRWGWWQEAWHAFTRHPAGGTGAGTFDLTNRLHRTDPFDVATEPHNTPLQFLTETGLPGLLLFLGAVGAAGLAVVRARRRTGDAAVTAVGIALGAWALHLVVDIDWIYAAVAAPLLLATGAVALAGLEPRPARARERPARRLLPAAGALVLGAAVVYSLALPWLGDRELDRAYGGSSYAHASRAHGWDPLSVLALRQMAATAPSDDRAFDLYRQALKLEPLNPDVWYELGVLQWSRGDVEGAYLALDRSWGLDRRDGPLARRCSLLDYARKRALGYGISCPPLGRAGLPSGRTRGARPAARRP